MRKRFVYVLLVMLIPFGLAQNPVGVVTLESQNTFRITKEKLETAIDNAGLSILSRVNHSANATKAELELPPTLLILFGNPSVGTPLMQEKRTIGLDLPQKMLIWQKDGSVYVSYNNPFYISARFDLQNQSERITNVSSVLADLAEAATSP